MDVPMVTALRARTTHIERGLINDVDRSFGVFDDGHFRQARFASYLKSHDIPWPTTTSGRLATDDDTFKAMARSYPELQPLHDLRRTLGQLGLGELVIRPDGRNSAMLSAFRSKTGRNQPSNAAFIFGFPSWMRGLIKPERGNAPAYIDWSPQEIGIAVARCGSAFRDF